LNTIAAQRAS